MVGLWLPHTTSFSMSPTATPALAASWLSARLWSRRSMAVKFFAGRSGADLIAMEALVLAGLPTTSTRSEEHTSELQALMRRPYAVVGWKQKKKGSIRTV